MRSVLRVARPIPGKCFSAAATRAESRPCANAVVAAATRLGSAANVRRSSAMNDPGAGTSATGARSTLIPAERSCSPVVRASSRMRSGPRRPSSEVARAGPAQGIRRISPPSWSVAIRSGARPDMRAARCIVATDRASCARFTTLAPKRMTPPTSPRRIRARSAGEGEVPFIATTNLWPTSSRIVGSGADGVARTDNAIGGRLRTTRLPAPARPRRRR